MKKIALFILIFTSSCAAFYKASDQEMRGSNSFINRFPENKKGIILLQLDSDIISSLWCKARLKIEDVNGSCIEIKPSKYHQILMLEPGLYEIVKYQKSTNSISRTTLREQKIEADFSNITKTRRNKPLISFEVFEKKINYIGQIKFKNSTQISDDSFDAIKNNLSLQNEKNLLQIFKNYNWEVKILMINFKDSPNFLNKNLARNRADFIEEKQIEKKANQQAKKVKKVMQKLKKQSLKKREL